METNPRAKASKEGGNSTVLCSRSFSLTHRILTRKLKHRTINTMKSSRTYGAKKLQQYLGEEGFAKFLAWYKENKGGHSKYLNFIPTDKQIHIYQSWVAGKTSNIEARKAFGCGSGTVYVYLAYVGAYLSKQK